MKTKIIIKMFAGILIGILATLFLTLNYWGSEIGKVILSIALGVIIGMFIADFKLSVQIFKNTGIAAWTFFVWCFNKICNINLNPKKVSKMTWIKRYLEISVFIKVVFMVFLTVLLIIFAGYEPSKGKILFNNLIVLLGVYIMTFCLFLCLSIATSSGIGLGFRSKFERRIWGKRKVYYSATAEGFFYETLCRIIDSRGILFYEKYFFRSILCFHVFLFKGIWKAIKVIITAGGYLIIAFSISLFLSIFFLPFWFLRELWKHKKMLVVVLSIVAGGIIGTYYESYLYGILTGFSVATISLLLERFLPEAKFFFYWKRLFANDDLWKKIWSIV